MVIAVATGMAACAGPATQPGWLDRPWIDSGCDAAGWCRLRGTLSLGADGGAVLALADGQRLTAHVPDRILQRREQWNGRRVAAAGRLRSDGDLDIVRLSLKGTR